MPQRKSRANAKFVASRREHGAKVGGADNLRLEKPVPKKPRRHTQKSVAKEALGAEASASAGSGGTGAEGRKKHKSKSFCAASTALTGVMLKQLLRNEHDTRTLCGVVFDTYIVSSQLKSSGGGKGRNAGSLRRSATEGPWSLSGTTVHLGVGGSGPRTHHCRDEAGRGTGAPLGITWKR